MKKQYAAYSETVKTYYEISQGDYISKLVEQEKKRLFKYTFKFYFVYNNLIDYFISAYGQHKFRQPLSPETAAEAFIGNIK